MTSRSVALIVVVACSAGACNRERRARLPEGSPAAVELQAEVTARPELVRDVWGNRMKAALEQGYLPVASAQAEIRGNLLVLTATLIAEGGCTPEKAQALGEALKATATRSGRLGIHRVKGEDAELLERQLRDALPANARVSTPHDLPGAIVVTGASADEITKLAAPMIPPGLSLFREAPRDDATNLRFWLVDEVPALDGRMVTRAWVEATETGAPSVRVSLSDIGARTFSDLTTEVLKQPLPIVFEDEVIAAPVVMGRIEAGNLQIALPPGRRAEAGAIAAMMTAGGLRETPKVVSLTANCTAQ